MKGKLLPLIPNNFSTNTHTYIAFVQVSYGDKDKYINAVSNCIIGTIEL